MKREPCPFCGSTSLTPRQNEGWYAFWIECDECGVHGPETMVEPEAVTLWNMRQTARQVSISTETVINLDTYSDHKGA